MASSLEEAPECEDAEELEDADESVDFLSASGSLDTETLLLRNDLDTKKPLLGAGEFVLFRFFIEFVRLLVRLELLSLSKTSVLLDVAVSVGVFGGELFVAENVLPKA